MPLLDLQTLLTGLALALLAFVLANPVGWERQRSERPVATCRS